MKYSLPRLSSPEQKGILTIRLIGLVFSLTMLGAQAAEAVYPASDIITGITFDQAGPSNLVPGNAVRAADSDNWAVTWADDDAQYTVYGDGIGFATENTLRASLGVVRLEGDVDRFRAFDVFKTGHKADGWNGKSVGIVSIDGTLWMFRNGDGSEAGALDQTELYRSRDKAHSWQFSNVAWHSKLNASKGDGIIFSPTFLQFGRDYQGARDQFVYVYAPRQTRSVSDNPWDVQRPGQILLLRVPRNKLADQTAYEYLSGFDDRGSPTWSNSDQEASPVFEDSPNGVMRTSVSYNQPLGRYLLCTQQVSRFADKDYHIGLYEAPEPWGPWKTVLFQNPQQLSPSLNTGAKTVFWNFSNKWLSADGKQFVMVYTGPGADEWGSIRGTFITRKPTNP